MTFEPWIEHDKRRETYVVRWRDLNGQKRRDTYAYETKTEARDRKTLVRKMLVNQSLGKVDLSRSPAQCLEEFLEDLDSAHSTRTGTTRCAIERFLSMKDKTGRVIVQTMADITRGVILDYKTSLQGAGLSDHTVQTYVSGCLRRWLGWCVDHKWLAVQPYEKIGVSAPKKMDRFFTDEEIADIEAQITDPEFLCIFKLGYRSGLRPGETMRLEEKDVRWDPALNKGELYIPPDEAKSDAGGRYAELPADVYAILPKCKGLLFPSWNEDKLKRHFRAARRKASVTHKVMKTRTLKKTLYWTRHTYAKRYLENGGSPKRLQNLMGHASIEITMDVYGHLDRSTFQDINVPPVRPLHISKPLLNGEGGAVAKGQKSVAGQK